MWLLGTKLSVQQRLTNKVAQTSPLLSVIILSRGRRFCSQGHLGTLIPSISLCSSLECCPWGLSPFRLHLLQGYFCIHRNLLLFQGLGPFKDMGLAFPEEWRHVTTAQIDCFGEYVEPQDCGVSPPGKTVSIPQVRNRHLEATGQGSCPCSRFQSLVLYWQRMGTSWQTNKWDQEKSMDQGCKNWLGASCVRRGVDKGQEDMR